MVIISLSSAHQKVWFDSVIPIEISLLHEQQLFHLKLSRAYFARFLLCFVLWVSCLQGLWGSWKIDLDFWSPMFSVKLRKLIFRKGAKLSCLITGKIRFSYFLCFWDFLIFSWPFWALGGFPWPSQNPCDHFSPSHASNRPTQAQFNPTTIFFDIFFVTFPNIFEKITSHTTPQTKPIG